MFVKVKDSDRHTDVTHQGKRYALAAHSSESGLMWSVGGAWSGSLISQSPTLLTEAEAGLFHKRHPNAHIVDVIYHLAALQAYNAGMDSVLDHNQRTTSDIRHAARVAGIKALIQAGFPENALEIGEKKQPGQIKLTLSDLYAKWDQLSDVPVNDFDEIELDFLGFSAGTHREEIWRWFERSNPEFVVGDVMQGIRKQVDCTLQST